MNWTRSAKKDPGLTHTICDRGLAGLEALRNRFRQDVEQEPLGALALGGDDRRRQVPLTNEVLEQEIRGSGDAEDVDREQRDFDTVRNLGPLRQQWLECDREPDDGDEGAEPTSRRSTRRKQQRT